MKSERRHELQQNALDAELAKSIAFFKAHGTTLLMALLGVVLVIGISIHAYQRHQTKLQLPAIQYDNVKSNMNNPNVASEKIEEELQKLAGQTDNVKVAALASVDLGDFYIKSYLGENDPAKRSELLSKAKQAYQLPIEKFKRESSAVAKANIGMAQVAESQGNFEAAKNYYQTVIQLGEQVGAAYGIAENAIKNIDQLKEPVRFATTRPTTQPAKALTLPTTQPSK